MADKGDGRLVAGPDAIEAGRGGAAMTGRQGDEEAGIRMTARVHEVEPGVIEGDYTIEPAEAAEADAEYVRRFATEAEARAWLQGMARAHGVGPADLVWVQD